MVWEGPLMVLVCSTSGFSALGLQKYTIKSMPLEEAAKVIQIAERARQGRLRALFMKQIYLQEYRARQARLLGEKVVDVEAAAVCIQKVPVGQGVGPWGGEWAGEAHTLHRSNPKSHHQNGLLFQKSVPLTWG